MSIRPDDAARKPRANQSGLPASVASALVAAVGMPLDAGVFSFTVEHATATYCVVRLAGEIDMLTAPDFRACLVQQLAARPRQLVLDFRGVTFVGSSGLAVLVGFRERAGLLGTNIYLVGADPLVARRLHATGLVALFGDDPPTPDTSLS